jgi:hypothetical protein
MYVDIIMLKYTIADIFWGHSTEGLEANSWPSIGLANFANKQFHRLLFVYFAFNDLLITDELTYIYEIFITDCRRQWSHNKLEGQDSIQRRH